MEQSDIPRPKPEPVKGAAHLLAAAKYSVGGVRRLWEETAFRHIVIALPICLGVLALGEATITEFCVFIALIFMLVAVEALNTSIECIVDHLAPHWQEFARDAKDLGSLATMCVLIVNGIFLFSFVFRAFLAA
ncbi:diacylglycerol kinase [Lentibacter sp.]|jgi:diacylglycerol kinase (ATP)|uniref:diacylglycerol kinase n=1 Tax=Lentibacter sp. TaxID=2024994 RepID=UPI0032D9AD01